MFNEELDLASSTVFGVPFLGANRSGRPAIHGVVDKIYVISLRHRESRRKEMERLRGGLGWDWTYVDALNATSPLSYSIIHWVSQIRARFGSSPWREHAVLGKESLADFSWPNTIEAMVQSTEQLRSIPDDLSVTSTQAIPQLASATKDYDIPDYSPGLPEYRKLTLTRIACWYSHLIVIQMAANRAAAATGIGSTLILEDDVDMERDVEMQLSLLWPSLPEDWDIVFLGMLFSHSLSTTMLILYCQGTVGRTNQQTSLYLCRSEEPRCLCGTTRVAGFTHQMRPSVRMHMHCQEKEQDVYCFT